MGLTLAKGCFSELAQALSQASPETRTAAIQLLADLFGTGRLKLSELCALLLNVEERQSIRRITDRDMNSLGSRAVDYESINPDRQQFLVRIFDVLLLALCRQMKAGLPDQDGVLGGLLKHKNIKTLIA